MNVNSKNPFPIPQSLLYYKDNAKSLLQIKIEKCVEPTPQMWQMAKHLQHQAIFKNSLSK